jgi:hypothetical protein
MEVLASSHMFQRLADCPNGTFVEVSGSGTPKIGGTSLKLIRIWNAKAGKFEPLV